MSQVPSVLKARLIQAALAISVAGAGAVGYNAATQPSAEVQLAQVLGSHYESSGKHIGVPYVDKLGKGQPLTVCNGVTGAGVVAGRYYTPDDCKRLEMPKYLEAEKSAKALFQHWGAYNVWVRASFIDMIYNVGTPAVAGSSMLKLANAGNLQAACLQQPRWVYGTVKGVSVQLGGLVDRRGTTSELCAEWGRDGHFSAGLLARAQVSEGGAQ